MLKLRIVSRIFALTTNTHHPPTPQKHKHQHKHYERHHPEVLGSIPSGAAVDVVAVPAVVLVAVVVGGGDADVHAGLAAGFGGAAGHAVGDGASAAGAGVA